MSFTPTNIIQVSPTVRVEPGPPRKTAKATQKLLDDKVTAKHYQVGRRDAMGKFIVLGEEMTYLDWKGDKVWYVYKLTATDVPLHPKCAAQLDPLHKSGSLAIEDARAVETGFVHRWLPVGVHGDKEQALAIANLAATPETRGGAPV
jgi:hypothetical protein